MSQRGERKPDIDPGRKKSKAGQRSLDMDEERYRSERRGAHGRDDDNQERKERRKQKGAREQREMSADGSSYIQSQGTSRAAGEFDSQSGNSGFVSFTEPSTPGLTNDHSHSQSSHVQDQFPGQFSVQPTAPYRPPLAASEGGPGLAAEYYGDAGQSVADQPGYRVHSPSLIVGAEPHLLPASSIVAPPPEPSASGGVGAAASFFDGSFSIESDTEVHHSQKPNTVNKPSSLQYNSAAPLSSTFASSGHRPSNGQHSSSAPVIPTLGGAAVGAAATYYINGQSSHQQRPDHESSSSSLISGTENVSVSASQHHQSETQNTYNSVPQIARPPVTPGKHSSQSSNFPLYAAGAAGVAAAAYNHNHHNSAHNSTNGQQHFGGSMSQRHRHRGPLATLVDFFKDPEGVAQYEEYTEYIGVCRYCFQPGSSPRDAPRKHRYYRRRSSERLGLSSRIDKDSRYSSSESENRRRNRKSWLGAGLTGYGLAKVGESLFVADQTAEDSNIVQLDRLKRSKSHVNSHSPDRRSQTLREGTRRSSEVTSSRRSHSRDWTEGDIASDGKFYRQDSHGRLDGSTISTHRTQRRPKSRSRSRSRRRNSVYAGIRVDAAPESTVVLPRSRRRSRSPEHATRHGSRDYSPELNSNLILNKPGTRVSQQKSSSNRRHKQKKNRGFFSFSNGSSSSSESAHFAFGNEFDKRRPAKTAKTRRKETYGADAALMGLGAAAAAAVALNQSQRSRRKGDLIAIKEAKGKNSRTEHLRTDKKRSSSEEDLWESASEGEWSSADSELAYGGPPRRKSSQGSISSDSAGFDKWGWRWGSKKRETRSKIDRTNDSKIDPPILAEVAAAAPFAHRVQPSVDGHQQDSRLNSSSNISLQHVYPVPTSDPSQFDVARQEVATFPHPLTNARPDPVPIQHPQPMVPVSSAIYTTQAPYTHSYSAPTDLQSSHQQPYQTQPSASGVNSRVVVDQSQSHVPGAFPTGSEFFSSYVPDQRNGTKPRRRDSSPITRSSNYASPPSSTRRRKSTKDDSSFVRFDLTKEQEDKDRREERRRRKEDEERRQKREYQVLEKQTQMEDDRMSEKRRSRNESSDDEKSSLKRQGDEKKIEVERKSWAVPAAASVITAAISATAAGTMPNIENGQSTSNEDSRGREERRVEVTIKERHVSPESMEESSKNNEGRGRSSEKAPISVWQAAAKIRRSSSHEDYAAYFTPTELLSQGKDVKKVVGANADNDITVYQVPDIVTIEPNDPGHAQSRAYSFPISADEIEPSNKSFPWPVPRLNLVEPTPPTSRAGSTAGSRSPYSEPYQHEETPIEIPLEPLESATSRVIYTEPETVEYKVIAPKEHRDETPDISGNEVNVMESVPGISSLKKRSVLEEAQPAISTKDGNGDDLEFAATLAAGLQDTGFDPSIVIDDPSFRRRDSPPGSEDDDFRPAGTVIESTSAVSKTKPLPHGFVEEIPDHQMPGGFHVGDEDQEPDQITLSEKDLEKSSKAVARENNTVITTELSDNAKGKPNISSAEPGTTESQSASNISIEPVHELEPDRPLSPERENEGLPVHSSDGEAHDIEQSGSQSRKSSHDAYDSLSEDAPSTVATAPASFAREQPGKSEKKSRRRSTGVDDSSSIVPSPSALSDSGVVKNKNSKERKGGLFGFFGKSTEITSEQKGVQETPTEASLEDFEEPKKRGKKSKGSKSAPEDDGASNFVSEPAQPSENLADDDWSTQKKPKRGKDRKKSSKGATIQASGTVTRDLPAKVFSPAFLSRNLLSQSVEMLTRCKGQKSSINHGEIESDVDNGSSSDQKQIETNQSPSFLEERPELPPIPDLPNASEDPGGQSISEQPLMSDDKGPSSDGHFVQRSRVDSQKWRLSDLSLENKIMSPSPPSSTAIPLRSLRFGRRPSSPGQTKSSPSTPLAYSTAEIPFTPSKRKERPRSTEFKSNEFRPMWLLEMHGSRQDPAPLETYPSLPSSHSTSRTSSVHEADDPDQEVAKGMELDKFKYRESMDGHRGLAINTNQQDFNPELLDSQQATPTAASFHSSTKEGTSRFAEVEQSSTESYSVDTSHTLNDKVMPTDYMPSDQPLLHSIDELFPNRRSSSHPRYESKIFQRSRSESPRRRSTSQNSDPRQESDFRTLLNDAALGAFIGGSAAAVLKARSQHDDHLGLESTNIKLAEISEDEQQQAARPMFVASPRLASDERQQSLKQDSQEVLDSSFDSTNPKDLEKEKEGKKDTRLASSEDKDQTQAQECENRASIETADISCSPSPSNEENILPPTESADSPHEPLEKSAAEGTNSPIVRSSQDQSEDAVITENEPLEGSAIGAVGPEEPTVSKTSKGKKKKNKKKPKESSRTGSASLTEVGSEKPIDPPDPESGRFVDSTKDLPLLSEPNVLDQNAVGLTSVESTVEAGDPPQAKDDSERFVIPTQRGKKGKRSKKSAPPQTVFDDSSKAATEDPPVQVPTPDYDASEMLNNRSRRASSPRTVIGEQESSDPNQISIRNLHNLESAATMENVSTPDVAQVQDQEKVREGIVTELLPKGQAETNHQINILEQKLGLEGHEDSFSKTIGEKSQSPEDIQNLTAIHEPQPDINLEPNRDIHKVDEDPDQQLQSQTWVDKPVEDAPLTSPEFVGSMHQSPDIDRSPQFGEARSVPEDIRSCRTATPTAEGIKAASDPQVSPQEIPLPLSDDLDLLDDLPDSSKDTHDHHESPVEPSDLQQGVDSADVPIDSVSVSAAPDHTIKLTGPGNTFGNSEGQILERADFNLSVSETTPSEKEPLADTSARISAESTGDDAAQSIRSNSTKKTKKDKRNKRGKRSVVLNPEADEFSNQAVLSPSPAESQEISQDKTAEDIPLKSEELLEDEWSATKAQKGKKGKKRTKVLENLQYATSSQQSVPDPADPRTLDQQSLEKRSPIAQSAFSESQQVEFGLKSDSPSEPGIGESLHDLDSRRNEQTKNELDTSLNSSKAETTQLPESEISSGPESSLANSSARREIQNSTAATKAQDPPTTLDKVAQDDPIPASAQENLAEESVTLSEDKDEAKQSTTLAESPIPNQKPAETKELELDSPVHSLTPNEQNADATEGQSLQGSSFENRDLSQVLSEEQRAPSRGSAAALEETPLTSEELQGHHKLQDEKVQNEGPASSDATMRTVPRKEDETFKEDKVPVGDIQNADMSTISTFTQADNLAVANLHKTEAAEVVYTQKDEYPVQLSNDAQDVSRVSQAATAADRISPELSSDFKPAQKLSDTDELDLYQSEHRVDEKASIDIPVKSTAEDDLDPDSKNSHIALLHRDVRQVSKPTEMEISHDTPSVLDESDRLPSIDLPMPSGPTEPTKSIKVKTQEQAPDHASFEQDNHSDPIQGAQVQSSKSVSDNHSEMVEAPMYAKASLQPVSNDELESKLDTSNVQLGGPRRSTGNSNTSPESDAQSVDVKETEQCEQANSPIWGDPEFVSRQEDLPHESPESSTFKAPVGEPKGAEIVNTPNSAEDPRGSIEQGQNNTSLVSNEDEIPTIASLSSGLVPAEQELSEENHTPNEQNLQNTFETFRGLPESEKDNERAQQSAKSVSIDKTPVFASSDDQISRAVSSSTDVLKKSVEVASVSLPLEVSEDVPVPTSTSKKDRKKAKKGKNLSDWPEESFVAEPPQKQTQDDQKLTQDFSDDGTERDLDSDMRSIDPPAETGSITPNTKKSKKGKRALTKTEEPVSDNVLLPESKEIVRAEVAAGKKDKRKSKKSKKNSAAWEDEFSNDAAQAEEKSSPIESSIEVTGIADKAATLPSADLTEPLTVSPILSKKDRKKSKRSQKVLEMEENVLDVSAADESSREPLIPLEGFRKDDDPSNPESTKQQSDREASPAPPSDAAARPQTEEMADNYESSNELRTLQEPTPDPVPKQGMSVKKNKKDKKKARKVQVNLQDEEATEKFLSPDVQPSAELGAVLQDPNTLEKTKDMPIEVSGRAPLHEQPPLTSKNGFAEDRLSVHEGLTNEEEKTAVSLDIAGSDVLETSKKNEMSEEFGSEHLQSVGFDRPFSQDRDQGLETVAEPLISELDSRDHEYAQKGSPALTTTAARENDVLDELKHSSTPDQSTHVQTQDDGPRSLPREEEIEQEQQRPETSMARGSDGTMLGLISAFFQGPAGASEELADTKQSPVQEILPIEDEQSQPEPQIPSHQSSDLLDIDKLDSSKSVSAGQEKDPQVGMPPSPSHMGKDFTSQEDQTAVKLAEESSEGIFSEKAGNEEIVEHIQHSSDTVPAALENDPALLKLTKKPKKGRKGKRQQIIWEDDTADFSPTEGAANTKKPEASPLASRPEISAWPTEVKVNQILTVEEKPSYPVAVADEFEKSSISLPTPDHPDDFFNRSPDTEPLQTVTEVHQRSDNREPPSENSIGETRADIAGFNTTEDDLRSEKKDEPLKTATQQRQEEVHDKVRDTEAADFQDGPGEQPNDSQRLNSSKSSRKAKRKSKKKPIDDVMWEFPPINPPESIQQVDQKPPAFPSMPEDSKLPDPPEGRQLQSPAAEVTQPSFGDDVTASEEPQAEDQAVDDWSSAPKKNKKGKKGKKNKAKERDEPEIQGHEDLQRSGYIPSSDKDPNEGAERSFDISKHAADTSNLLQDPAIEEPAPAKSPSKSLENIGVTATAAVVADSGIIATDEPIKDETRQNKEGKPSQRTNEWTELDENGLKPLQEAETSPTVEIGLTPIAEPDKASPVEQGQRSSTPHHSPTLGEAYQYPEVGDNNPTDKAQSPSSRNRDSAVHVPESSHFPEQSPPRRAVRDSGYPDTEPSPTIEVNSEKEDPDRQGEIHNRPDQAYVRDRKDNLEEPRHANPFNIEVEVDPDYDVVVSQGKDSCTASSQASVYQSDLESKGLPEQSDFQPISLNKARQPSPVSSTTKDRSSVLFQSSPSTRDLFSDQHQHLPASPLDNAQFSSVENDHQAFKSPVSTSPTKTLGEDDSDAIDERAKSLAAQGDIKDTDGQQRASLFGGPVGVDSDATSPSRSPSNLDASARQRLKTITEYSPEDSPLHKKNRDLSDVRSPDHGVKSARRSETPQAISQRRARALSPEGRKGSASNEDPISHLSWPPIDEERRQTDPENSPIQGHEQRPSSRPSSIMGLKHREHERRSLSGASDRSVESINAIIRTPEQMRSASGLSNRSSGTPPLRRVDRSVSGDLRGANRKSEAKQRAKDAEAEQELAIPSSSTSIPEADPSSNKGKGRVRDMADVYVSHSFSAFVFLRFR